MPKEYYKTANEIAKLKKEIIEDLPFDTENHTKIEQLCELTKELSSIDCEQCFIYGFQLATRLVSESFLTKKEEH